MLSVKNHFYYIEAETGSYGVTLFFVSSVKSYPDVRKVFGRYTFAVIGNRNLYAVTYVFATDYYLFVFADIVTSVAYKVVKNLLYFGIIGVRLKWRSRKFEYISVFSDIMPNRLITVRQS